MKTYRGYRRLNPGAIDNPLAGECLVNVWTEGGVYRPLPLRTDIRNYTSGFWWGCYCDGSSQLAVALVADVMGDATATPILCQCFRAQVVDWLATDGWILTETEIREAMDAILVELGQP